VGQDPKFERPGRQWTTQDHEYVLAVSHENEPLHTPLDNKAPKADLQNRREAEAFTRVPTGQADAGLRVRVLTDGPVPRLDIRTFRRSPAKMSADAFPPAAAGVTLEAQFAEKLIATIQKARAAA
jgi:hypothetical protein